MYIPKRWADKSISACIDVSGMSPAEVIKCKPDSDWLYLKSIDVKYSDTTFSARREKDVMEWLSDKLNVPRVIDFGCENNREFLVMSELKGKYIDDIKEDPEEYITHLANCIKLLQSIDISKCPFDSSLKVRLTELDYLLRNGLASVDTEDWEETTTFSDPDILYQWLCDHKPVEEFVFSHGDLTANIFINDSDYYFYDLGRAGVADKWLDIAFGVCDIRGLYKNKKYEDMFFELLNIQPNYEKIDYFILLDEMF